MSDRHPATTGLLRWFEYAHLPPHLQAVSAPVGELAREMTELLPDGPELSAGLRKLLEAKDCLVRAAIDADLPVMTRSARVMTLEGADWGEVRSVASAARCPHRVHYVGEGAPDGWLECARAEGHIGRMHRTADGTTFR